MTAFEEEPPAIDSDEELPAASSGESQPEIFAPLRVVDVELVLPATHPVLILEEIASPRRQCRVPIGVAEGVAISYALKGVATRKPLTHELFADVLTELGVFLEVVRITDLDGEIFTAELVLSGPSGSRVVPCRLSDGVALALRQALPAPVTIDADLLDRVGVLES